jgi:hypothetical protein
VFPLFVGTQGCPAAPEFIYDVFQYTQHSAMIGFCANAPARGTLTFSSSDANALLPDPTPYNALALTASPQTASPIVFRTPGVHTLTARDAANNITLVVRVQVNHAVEILGYECASLAVALPPKITVVDVGHPLAVSNCTSAATPVLTFSSSDPLATLPAPRAFAAGPNFGEAAGNAVFRTPGIQFVYLRDPAGALVSQTAFDVRSSNGLASFPSVPVNAAWALGLLVLGMGVLSRRALARRGERDA